MTDVTDRLRAHARALDAAYEPPDPAHLRALAADAVRPVTVDPDERGSGRGALMAVAAGVVILLVVAGAVVAARSRSGGSQTNMVGGPSTVVVAPEPPAPTEPPEPPYVGPASWQALPTYTPTDPGVILSSAPTPTPIWTGSEVLFVGSLAPDEIVVRLGPILALEPVSGAWRTLPEPPQAITDQVAVWTGQRVVVIGRSPAGGPVAASLDPGTGTWTPTSPPGPQTPNDGAVWTGDRVLAWGMSAGVVSFDPAADRWEQLAGPWFPKDASNDLGPVLWASGGVDSVWTGTELIVVDRDLDTSKRSYQGAFNPTTRTWRELPKRPNGVAGPLRWTGRLVTVVNGAAAATLDPAHADAGWTVTPGPAGISEASANVVIGDRQYVWGGRFALGMRVEGPTITDAVSFDVLRERWHRVSPAPATAPPVSDIILAGDLVVTWGLAPEPAPAGATMGSMRWGELRAWTMPVSMLSDPARATAVGPDELAPAVPPNIDRDQLAVATNGMLGTDGVLTAFRATDSLTGVLDAQEATARAALDPRAPAGLDTAELWWPKLGHWQAAGQADGPLAWLLTWETNPRTDEREGWAGVVDATTGAIIVPPTKQWPRA